MKTSILLSITAAIGLSLSGCKETPETPQTKEQSFYIGTYTQGASQGIYQASINDKGQFTVPKLVAATENPSYQWRSADDQFLVSVNENTDGSIQSFRIEQDTLIPVSVQSSMGAHPCHLSGNDRGDLVVSNYTGGNIGFFTLNDKGQLQPSREKLDFKGKGSHPRQEAPHAHSSYPYASFLLTCDLGTDKIWVTGTDVARQDTPQPEDSIVLTAGSGPRHLSFHPSKPWIYAINELNSTITHITYDRETKKFTPGNSFPTLPTDYEGENFCADIHIDQTGGFLYASNRGHDSIVIFSIDPDSGDLQPVGWESVQGHWPRNFALSPDNAYLLVANERSDELLSFVRNKEDGTLTFSDRLKIPAPVCITF